MPKSSLRLVIPVRGKVDGKIVVVAYTTVPNDEFGKELAKFNWSRSTWGYVRRNKPKIDGKHQGYLYLHKIVCEKYNGPIPDGQLVDHIDRDILNNIPNNLQVANKSHNSANCGRSHNTSGYTGVTWNKRIRKWCAMIRVNKKSIWLKSHNCPVVAARAVNEAYKKYRPTLTPPNAV